MLSRLSLLLLPWLCVLSRGRSRRTERGGSLAGQAAVLSEGLCRYGNSLECCWGWRQTEQGQCQPHCEQGCKHGHCVGPDRCKCHPGYAGKACNHDLNECGLKPRPCKHRCMNTVGSYKCFCQDGFALQLDGTCQNARTCYHANCQYGCEVMKGAVRCTCPSPGLRLGPDRRSCIDIDECARGGGVCPRRRKCVNTFGSFLCKCHLGFKLTYLDGRYSCVDKDPRPFCSLNPGAPKCRCRDARCQAVAQVALEPPRPRASRTTTPMSTPPASPAPAAGSARTAATSTAPTHTHARAPLTTTAAATTTTTAAPPTSPTTTTAPPTSPTITTAPPISPTTTTTTTTVPPTSPTTTAPPISPTTTVPPTTTPPTTPTTAPPTTLTTTTPTTAPATAPTTTAPPTAPPTTITTVPPTTSTTTTTVPHTTPTTTTTTVPHTTPTTTTAPPTPPTTTTTAPPSTTSTSTSDISMESTVQTTGFWSRTTLNNRINKEVTHRQRGDVHIPRHPSHNQVWEFDIELGNTALKDDPGESALHCSFEGGLCDWMSERDGDLRWQVTGGPQGQRFLSVPELRAGQRSVRGARLSVSLARLWGGGGGGGSLCFSFSHWLTGHQLGVLQLFARGPDRRYSPALWSRTGGHGWRRTQVTLTTHSMDKVVLKAERRKGRGKIAIDDVTLRRGACR